MRISFRKVEVNGWQDETKVKEGYEPSRKFKNKSKEELRTLLYKAVRKSNQSKGVLENIKNEIIWENNYV
mgnify:CR=1 FL=1